MLSDAFVTRNILIHHKIDQLLSGGVGVAGGWGTVLGV